MTINFECGACGRTIEAPDAAGGKRGKCPYCGQSNDIPRPPAEAGDLLADCAVRLIKGKAQ